MPTLVTIALVGVLVVAVVAVALWYSRTRTLAHRVGSFRCGLGRSATGPWSSGLAQYGAEHLYWWRHWSLAPRPGRRWKRRGLTVVERTDAGSGMVAVTCRAVGSEEFYVTMTREAYAGLTSWIEATPSRIDSVI